MRTKIWKGAKWMAICTTGLIAVLVLAFAWWYWRAGVELDRRIAAIRGAGLPATISDLATEKIAPEKNALTFLRRARADAMAIETELRSVHEKLAEKRELSDADWKQIADTLAAFPNVLPLIDKAANCAEYRSAEDFTKRSHDFLSDALESTNLSRTISRVLDKHIALLISQSKLDDAVRAALTLDRIGRHIENEPTITCYLVSQVVRGVALGRLADILQHSLQHSHVRLETRRLVEDELAGDKDSSGFTKALISERAFGNSSFFEFSMPLMRKHQNDYLDFMEKQIETADSPYYETLGSTQTGRPASTSGPFVSLVSPAVQAAREAGARILALTRAIRVLNCILSSPELVKSEEIALPALPLPKDATVDPFTGQALIARKTATGWLVYSVGRDLKDDGGKTETNEDVGSSPRK